MLLALIQAAALAVPLLHADPPVDGTLSNPAWKSAQNVTLDWDQIGRAHV